MKVSRLNRSNSQRIQAIKRFAGGSIYRLNATTAKYYSFTLDKRYKIDGWCGGWSWEGEEHGERYSLNLESGIIYDNL